MKNITKIFAIALLALGFSVNVLAQATASQTANAAATIVTPLTIAKDLDMNFGNVAVGGNAGTVILPASATPTRGITGGVTLPTVTGTVRAAKFTVSGTPTYVYTFSVPSADLLVKDGANQMTVKTFSKSASGTLSAGGTEVVYVGATLEVGANQPAGIYASDVPFEVTAIYN